MKLTENNQSMMPFLLGNQFTADFKLLSWMGRRVDEMTREDLLVVIRQMAHQFAAAYMTDQSSSS